MSKIIEKILEPSKIYVGSNFKLKIKAIRYAIYKELQKRKYSDVKKVTYNQLKGE